MKEHKCPPPQYPADQPAPIGDGGDCDCFPETTPPTPPEVKKCEPKCPCPGGSGGGNDCLDTLIEAQAGPITAGDKAKLFKVELEALLAKANAAKGDYTQEKYEKLLELWVEQDHDIAELARKIDCFLPCWKCVLDCHVCTLLYDMREAEQRLYGDGEWCDKARDLQDLLYWHTRDRDEKKRIVERIKAIFAAWEKPAQTIEKILADNAKLISDAYKALGNQDSKVIFDVFFRLIPLHLAIAPAEGVARTHIEKIFTDLCACDDRKPCFSCGIDVGERSFRQRLIGPQPSLILPGGYVDLLCCLLNNAYVPATTALAAAEASVVLVESQIKRYRGVIENGLKNFDKTARAAIPALVDCDKYEPKAKS